MSKWRNSIKLIVRSIIGKNLFERINIRRQLGYWPHIHKPRTFCEHLTRMKLYERDPRFVEYSDKFLVRDFIKSRIGEEYLSTLYAVVRSADELPRDLPESFVLKATYGSGINYFMEGYTPDKYSDLKTTAEQMLERRHMYGELSGQWWYNKIEPRLIAEERILDSCCKVPVDYKFYCFGGEPVYVTVDNDRFGAHTRSFYDMDWNLQDFSFVYPIGQPQAPPRMLEKMVQLARILSTDFPFVRIDFYNPTDSDRIVFGEITFAPNAGWIPFYPEQMWPDMHFGELWQKGLERMSL